MFSIFYPLRYFSTNIQIFEYVAGSGKIEVFELSFPKASSAARQDHTSDQTFFQFP
jgi:hypothetical protein